MKPFRFCPACGAELGGLDSEDGAACAQCGRTWYRNPAPTVGCVIVQAGRALVTTRALAPMKGMIDVPGGFIRVDEDALDALRREISEELGIEIDVGYEDFLQTAIHKYGDDEEFDWVLSLGFKARIKSGDPAPADDVAALRWITASELSELDFAWEHDEYLVRKALENE